MLAATRSQETPGADYIDIYIYIYVKIDTKTLAMLDSSSTDSFPCGEELCARVFRTMPRICIRNMAGDEVAVMDAEPQWTAAEVQGPVRDPRLLGVLGDVDLQAGVAESEKVGSEFQFCWLQRLWSSILDTVCGNAQLTRMYPYPRHGHPSEECSEGRILSGMLFGRHTAKP
jgi:hypothetical protein